MNLKKYDKIRLGIVFITAFIFSQCLVLHNFFIPIMVLGLSSLILFYLRKKVVDVIADERDYQIGGKSALLAIQITSWVGVIVMFVLYVLSDKNSFYEPIAMTLAFFICLLMLTYSVIFKYYSKYSSRNEKQH